MEQSKLLYRSSTILAASLAFFTTANASYVNMISYEDSQVNYVRKKANASALSLAFLYSLAFVHSQSLLVYYLPLLVLNVEIFLEFDADDLDKGRWSDS